MEGWPTHITQLYIQQLYNPLRFQIFLVPNFLGVDITILCLRNSDTLLVVTIGVGNLLVFQLSFGFEFVQSDFPNCHIERRIKKNIYRDF